METVYDRIEQRLKEINMNKRQLADEAEIPYSTLISAFNRKSSSFSFDYLEKIAKVLNIDIDYLLHGNIEALPVDIIEPDGTTSSATLIRTANGGKLYLPETKDQKDEQEGRLGKLLTHFKKLNTIGKDKAVENVELLTKVPEYTVQDVIDMFRGKGKLAQWPPPDLDTDNKEE